MAEPRKKLIIPPKRRQEAEEAFIRAGQMAAANEIGALVKKAPKQTVSKTIRVTPAEFKAVQQRAIDEGVPYSDVIRAAICEYLGLPFDRHAGAK